MSEVQTRLLNNFSKRTPLTCNEVIERLHEEDYDSRIRRPIHYYTHLNKLPAILMKKDLLIDTGETKLGPTKHQEKLWLRA